MSTEHLAETAVHHASAASQSPDIMALIFESNLINFVLVAGLIVWALNKFIPELTHKRKEELQTEIIEAQKAKAEAEAKLQELEAKLQESKSEAKQFLEDAKHTAAKIREQILEDTKQEIKHMQDLAEKDIEQQRAQIMQSIKERVIDAAFKLSEESVRSNANRKQIEETINQQFRENLAGVSI